jgi:hypothetical protein
MEYLMDYDPNSLNPNELSRTVIAEQLYSDEYYTVFNRDLKEFLKKEYEPSATSAVVIPCDFDEEDGGDYDEDSYEDYDGDYYDKSFITGSAEKNIVGELESDEVVCSVKIKNKSKYDSFFKKIMKKSKKLENGVRVSILELVQQGLYLCFTSFDSGFLQSGDSSIRFGEKTKSMNLIIKDDGKVLEAVSKKGKEGLTIDIEKVVSITIKAKESETLGSIFKDDESEKFEKSETTLPTLEYEIQRLREVINKIKKIDVDKDGNIDFMLLSQKEQLIKLHGEPEKLIVAIENEFRDYESEYSAENGDAIIRCTDEIFDQGDDFVTVNIICLVREKTGLADAVISEEKDLMSMIPLNTLPTNLDTLSDEEDDDD